jgi:hypothetical protein
MTMVLVSFSSCATKIEDFQFCGLNPKTEGAACDNFLISQPKTLDKQGLADWIASVQASGQVVELTTSSAVASFKKEFEKLCTPGRCTYDEKKVVSDSLDRIDGVKHVLLTP